MTIYPLFNGAMYYAIQRDHTGKCAGYIGKGITHTDALLNCLKAIRGEVCT